jgi:hypothetical protein
MPDNIREAVSVVLELLVKSKFEQLEKLTHGVCLSAKEIRAIIHTYGRTLISPPPAAFDLMNASKVRDSKPPQWSITMPLWTLEEGRSDLSIELTLLEKEEGYKIELDDLHVL